MKVLLVDDDEGVRRLLEVTLVLIVPDVEVSQAETGEQALALCEQIKPNCVVVDGLVPGIAGDALGEGIRDIVPTATIVSFSGTESHVEWADCQVVKATSDALEKVISALTEEIPEG
jgi:DNA-binding NtrC family response regulator